MRTIQSVGIRENPRFIFLPSRKLHLDKCRLKPGPT
jgi:hypothetical protein